MALNKEDFTKKLTKKELEEQQNLNFLNSMFTRKKGIEGDAGFDALFGIEFRDVKYLKIEDLVPYSNSEAGHDSQPFSVKDDDEMKALVEDIRENSIIYPLIINKKGDKYMILSGHRRVHAAKILGLRDVPCIIKEYNDIQAANVVISSNLLVREKILPSERAMAYKLKIDVLKQQGKRSDLTFAQVEQKLEGHNSYEIVAAEEGVSRAQIQRYISLNLLIPELLEMIDTDRVAFNTGVNLSSIPHTAQKKVYEVIIETGKLVTLDMSSKIKELDDLSKPNIRDIINPKLNKKAKTEKEKNAPKEVIQSGKEKAKRYITIPFEDIADKFSATATDEEIIARIIKALSIEWINEIT